MVKSPKACVSGDRCQPRTLAEAFYCLVHHSTRKGLRIEPSELAQALGKRVGYLLDAANPDRDEVALQASLLIPATLFTGNTIALRFFAAQTNGIYFQLPEVLPGHEDLLDRLAVVRVCRAHAEGWLMPSASPIFTAMLTIRRAEQLSDAGDQFSSVSFVREVHALTEARKAATGRIDNVITGLVDHRTGLALAAQGRGVGARKTWVGKAR